jgi:hypothetical protein
LRTIINRLTKLERQFVLEARMPEIRLRVVKSDGTGGEIFKPGPDRWRWIPVEEPEEQNKAHHAGDTM